MVLLRCSVFSLPTGVLFLCSADVVGEDAVINWYEKSHHPKGKTVFLEQMSKMVAWLQEAEEESSSEEEDDGDN